MSVFNWIHRLMGHDGGLAQWVRVGDLIQHCNTGQWGRVIRVIPQHDGTAELVLDRIVQARGESSGLAYWATYHAGDWAPTFDVPRPADVDTTVR